jgi:membrane protein
MQVFAAGVALSLSAAFAAEKRTRETAGMRLLSPAGPVNLRTRPIQQGIIEAKPVPRGLGKVWDLIKRTAAEFMEDEALTHGAAIAYYALFSIAPLLLIVLAIAGLVFGHDAALTAMMNQLTGLVGQASAKMLQEMIEGASNKSSGTLATVIGAVTLLVTVSGAFGEIQSALNDIWKAEPRSGLTRLVRARLASLGLVLTLGFLMIVSLVVSAGLAALGGYMEARFSGAHAAMAVANFVISLLVLSVLFAAVYKILPDTPIAWRDVIVGSLVTALLFMIGKSLIGIYIARSHLASSYGAAGALIVVLAWIYYSAQIFLLGAEFTKVFAGRDIIIAQADHVLVGPE